MKNVIFKICQKKSQSKEKLEKNTTKANYRSHYVPATVGSPQRLSSFWRLWMVPHKRRKTFHEESKEKEATASIDLVRLSLHQKPASEFPIPAQIISTLTKINNLNYLLSNI